MALNIPTEGTKLNELKINIVDTQATFEAMKTANKVNANELYFIEQELPIIADSLKTGHTFKVNLASENASTAFNGTADITDIGVSGALPVKHGGTGFTTATYKNAVVIGNSSTVTNQLQTIRTASGAFYATGQDAKPSFGTLPIAQGGTGATSAANARTNLGLGTMATETAANYLKLAGGTMTGGVTFVGNQSSAWNDKGILFTNGSRIGENSSKALGLYSASTFYIRPDSGTASSGKGLEISSTAMIPSVNNEMDLGSSDKKFKAIYATTLNGNLAWSNITSKPTTLSGYGITDAKINNGTITLGNNSITPLTAHQTVTNKNATLGWNTAITVATIGNTDIKISLPTNPNTDTKVTQNNTTAANDYRILLSGQANDTTATEGANKSTNLRFNPSTKILSVGGSISATGDLAVTGNTNLNGETYAENITAGSLLVNGNTNFVQIPTAPTPATTSNDTSIATTAFVKNNLGGLSGAMHFKGTTTTALNDGTTTAAVTISGNSYTPSAGDVVLYSDSEFVWTGSAWERLGRDSSFKVTQTAVTDTAYSGTDTSTTFVTAVTQNANGEITVTKRKLPTYNNYSHPTTTAVNAAAVKVGKDNLGHVVLGDALTASDVGAATSGHTHTTALATNTGTATVTLAHNTTYKLTTGGTSVIFKTPTDNNTWNALSTSQAGYVAQAPNDTTKFLRGDASWATLPVATSSVAGIMKLGANGGAATYGHTHTTSLATDTGTSTITLESAGKYKLTAGGTSVIFTMPTSNNYSHPTTTAASAAAVKVGKDSLGHVVLGNALTKSDVGLGNVENTALSTWTGSTAITTLGTISTGTVPWARLSNVPTTFTPASHTHGNLTNDGKISTTATINSGDKLVIVDSDSTAASKITGSSITFGTSTTTFLSNKGTWVTPPGTYSLPLAASGTRGGIQIGYSESGNNYAVKLSSEKAYVTVPWTDTKNTAGSTDTSSKIYLIGATSQAVNPQTYSDNQIYATNGQLDANKVRVAEAVSLVYDTTLQALNFVFA